MRGQGGVNEGLKEGSRRSQGGVKGRSRSAQGVLKEWGSRRGQGEVKEV
jgi:hypothetical protein